MPEQDKTGHVGPVGPWLTRRQLHRLGVAGLALAAAATSQPFQTLIAHAAPSLPLIEPGHPRLYFNQDELVALRLRSADSGPTILGPSGQQLWADVVRLADTYVAESSFSIGYIGGVTVTYPLPPEQPGPRQPPPGYTAGPYPYWSAMGSGIRDRLEAMSMAYAVTGEARYGNRVVDYLLALADWQVWSDPAFTTQLTSLDTSYITFGVAMGYDVTHGLLTPQQRSHIAAAMDRMGMDPLWRDSVEPGDHNIAMLRVASLGAGAAVLHGTEIDTEKYLGTVVTDFAWYLAQRRTTGTQEGFLYSSFALDNILRSGDVVKRVTGVDTLLGDPMFNAQSGQESLLMRWILHSLVPGSQSLAPISDSDATAYFPVTAAVLYSTLGNRHAGWYLKNAQPSDTAFSRFLASAAAGPISDPTDLPLCTTIEEYGWASLRSGWTADDTLLLLVANDSRAGHNHYDQNSFILGTNNTWIANDPGYRDYLNGPTNRFTTTFGHNTVYVDHEPQSHLGGGTLHSGVLSEWCAYVVGEAAGAYQSPALSQFQRHVVAIPNEYYLIHDQIEAPEPHSYQWSMYNGQGATHELDGDSILAPTTGTGSQVRVHNSTAQLCLTLVDPSPASVVVADFPGTEGRGAMTTIDSGAPATTATFSTIVQAAPYRVPGWFEAETLISTAAAGGLVYKTLGISGSTVLFVRSGAVGDTLTLSFDLATTGIHQLAAGFGMSPAYAQLQVSVDGTPVGAAQDCYAAAAGLSGLRDIGSISLTAGHHTISLTATGKNTASSAYYMSLDAFQLTVEGQPVTATPIPAVTASRVTDSTGFAAQVTRTDGELTDLIAIRTTATPLVVQGTRTDGSQLLITTNPAGDVVGYALSDGRDLAQRQKTLLRASRVVSASVRLRDLVDATIIADERTEISLHSHRSAGVLIDGAAASFTVGRKRGMVTFTVDAGTHHVEIR